MMTRSEAEKIELEWRERGEEWDPFLSVKVMDDLPKEVKVEGEEVVIVRMWPSEADLDELAEEAWKSGEVIEGKGGRE